MIINIMLTYAILFPLGKYGERGKGHQNWQVSDGWCFPVEAVAFK
jgi:hypothetical protein